MAKNITEKYEMEFTMNEVEITAPVKLTKKEYSKRLNEAMQKHLESLDLEPEFQIDYMVKERDYGTFTVIRHYFTSGCTDFSLAEFHCKEGYRFTK